MYFKKKVHILFVLIFYMSSYFLESILKKIDISQSFVDSLYLQNF